MIPAEREPIAASIEEQRQIRTLVGFNHCSTQHAPGIAKLISASGRAYELPDTVVRLLAQVVEALAQGEVVSIVSVHKELTTQEAADLLNISRQYLVRLLDRGEIPHHKVGTHRRIAFDDLMRYKRHRDHEREKGFNQLAQLSQDLGLYE